MVGLIGEDFFNGKIPASSVYLVSINSYTEIWEKACTVIELRFCEWSIHKNVFAPKSFPLRVRWMEMFYMTIHYTGFKRSRT